MAQDLYRFYNLNGKYLVDIELSDSVRSNSAYSWSDFIHGKKSGRFTVPVEHYNNMLDIEGQASTIKLNSQIDFSITSVYRPNSEGSDHSRGAAMDLHARTPADRKALWDHIYGSAYSWRQLIWEDQLQSGNANSRGSYPDYPGIIHFAYKTGENKKQVLYTSDKGQKGTCSAFGGAKGTAVAINTTGPAESTGNTGSKNATENPTGDGAIPESELNKGDNLVGSYNKTLEQSDYALKDLELGDVDRTWGEGYEVDGGSGDKKRYDWISLKQFLLYLATRFTPQSVYPFVELIPEASLSAQDYNRDGDATLDNNNNITTKEDGPKSKSNKEKPKSQAPSQNNTLKTNTKAGIDATNREAGVADLFSMDPWQESYSSLDVLSVSGKEVQDRRGVGVRVYSQLVLNPPAGVTTPSKPGAIGFTELSVNAGAQCDNGIAMISMKLTDVQGNKFTDLTSPWAFIFDARPGGVGGDFYFRYGWQIRVPDPKDKTDLASKNFWNHRGWLLFDDKVRQFIAGQISPSKPYITLTQSINATSSSDKSRKGDYYALFDEGVEMMKKGNNVSVVRTNLHPQNYIKLALLNPELEVESDGAITATLNFRTVGALAATLPLLYASNVRKAVAVSQGNMTLGDLIVLVQTDFAQFEYLSMNDPDTKDIQANYISGYLGGLAKNKNRDLTNLITVVGLEEGGGMGDTNPDSIFLNMSTESIAAIVNANEKDGIQLIGWVRDVLGENGMQLSSVATGSGAGINSSWIITVGSDFNKDMYVAKQKDKPQTASDYINALQMMIEEKDIFSFRFQGSLVDSIKIEKTESSNSLKIATDYAISDFLPTMGSATNKDIAEQFNKPVTVADRRRNLNILFSQLQNVTVHSLCHPWIGPGKEFFIKGMGFWDGSYKALKVTHKLSVDGKFISEIGGARMIIPSSKEENAAAKSSAAQNGRTETSQPVDSKYKDTNKVEKPKYESVEGVAKKVAKDPGNTKSIVSGAAKNNAGVAKGDGSTKLITKASDVSNSVKSSKAVATVSKSVSSDSAKVLSEIKSLKSTSTGSTSMSTITDIQKSYGIQESSLTEGITDMKTIMKS